MNLTDEQKDFIKMLLSREASELIFKGHELVMRQTDIALKLLQMGKDIDNNTFINMLGYDIQKNEAQKDKVYELMDIMNERPPVGEGRSPNPSGNNTEPV